MIERVNDAIRQDDIEEATRSIDFLKRSNEKNVLITLDQISNQLIEEQLKIIMLANASKEYVFQVVEPPIAPIRKFAPSRSVICLVTSLLGFFLAFGYCLMTELIQSQDRYRKSGKEASPR